MFFLARRSTFLSWVFYSLATDYLPITSITPSNVVFYLPSISIATIFSVLSVFRVLPLKSICFPRLFYLYNILPVYYFTQVDTFPFTHIPQSTNFILYSNKTNLLYQIISFLNWLCCLLRRIIILIFYSFASSILQNIPPLKNMFPWEFFHCKIFQLYIYAIYLLSMFEFFFNFVIFTCLGYDFCI